MFIVKSQFFLVLLKTAFACDGYKYVTSNAVNCGGPNQIIQAINTSFTLNKDCEITSKSCSHLEPYSSAIMELKIFDNSMIVHQSMHDICSSKKKPENIASNMAALGVPTKCPVNTATDFCYKGGRILALSKVVRKLLALFHLGTIMTAKVNITHDTGKSCFEMNFTIMKT